MATRKLKYRYVSQERITASNKKPRSPIVQERRDLFIDLLKDAELHKGEDCSFQELYDQVCDLKHVSNTIYESERIKVKMTFGKFRGTAVEDLEDWYLRYCVEDYTIHNKELEEALITEYENRNLGIKDEDLGIYG